MILTKLGQHTEDSLRTKCDFMASGKFLQILGPTPATLSVEN